MKLHIHSRIASILPLAALLALAGSGWGVTFNLETRSFTRQLPGGPGGRTVTMWGFALAGEQPSSPGPKLQIPPGDNELVINLTNYLDVPVSIVIPGMSGFVRDAPNSTVTDSAGRVRALSFVKETPAKPADPAPAVTVTYRWLNPQPGTFLYHSGSHAALQVQMGLHGAVRCLSVANEAYPGVPFDSQETIVFSEIDVDVHDAVEAGTYGTTIKSMIHSVPEYFLVDGVAYDNESALQIGTVGQISLLRLLNACADERVITFSNGQYCTIVAEDGNKYNYPKVQYAINLPALKTRDVLFTPAVAETFMLYDLRLALSSPTLDERGGMYRRVSVGPAAP